MENINTTQETPIQLIETPITPETTPTPPKSNIFKYLFIISIVVLVIVIISFILILNNKNTKQTLIEQNINDITEVTPTIIPTYEVTPIETATPTIKILTLEEELYPFVNPEKDPNTIFSITKTEGDFAYINIGSRNGGGLVTIWKKENGKWKELIRTQDMWECETVMKENIPPSLVNNECLYYKTQETWKYNTISSQWEKR